jgi:hypothetical protein
LIDFDSLFALKMSEIEDIKQDIADTKAELTHAKRKLAEAVVDKNQSEIEEWKARRNTLEALLLEQRKKENILLVSRGKFTLLSLFIAFKNLLNSTFLIHMMTDNALFHFLSASVAAPVPTGKL